MTPAALDDLLASSAWLHRHLQGVRRAAASHAPVLILGEAGTGRSRLARAIHQDSSRRQGPLVELDAGSVPASLFESDLFGYRAGAFTGAGEDSLGRVGRARGGTLLLDHVEELPLAVQPKLLRLIAEGRFAPLGGEEREADVRFLAIGAEDLSRRVRQGAFRQDLFYRLEVLCFRLPPLRERRQELPAILSGLLADLGERFGRPGIQVSDRALRWMGDYSWPGNLRQLRNLLERSLVLSEGGLLDPAPPREEGPPQTLEQLEKEHIRRALAYTRGHQGRAAQLLGISRKALWEKRRRYDLP